MSDILYKVSNSLYANLTNRCPCACTFCVRQQAPGYGGAENLWLETEPTIRDVRRELAKFDLSRFDEFVFCGYGEPTEVLDLMLETAALVKEQSDIPIRLNTNGLSDLINQKPTAHLLEGLIDRVSVSLNAANAREYVELCSPIYGEAAYPAMLQFARDCTAYVPVVQFTVVDVNGDAEYLNQCRRIAEEHGVQLRIRPFEEGETRR
jgi:radical SAM enzyme (TIGR04100 family)